MPVDLPELKADFTKQDTRQLSDAFNHILGGSSYSAVVTVLNKLSLACDLECAYLPQPEGDEFARGAVAAYRQVLALIGDLVKRVNHVRQNPLF